MSGSALFCAFAGVNAGTLSSDECPSSQLHSSPVTVSKQLETLYKESRRFDKAGLFL